MTTATMPTLRDVIAARPHVYRYLKPTALHPYPGLSELVGAQVWVKHENHQPQPQMRTAPCKYPLPY